MLKLISWTIQTVFFTLLVLVLGNWIRLDGKTVSDHVKVKMQSVQKIFGTEQREKIVKDLPERIPEKVKKLTDRVTFGSASPSKKDHEASQKDREELRDLIRKF